MIRIAIVGDIGSGKSYFAKLFGYPVFNADKVVAGIYKTNKKWFNTIKKKLPNFFTFFPLKKEELIKCILSNKNNLKIITEIIHPLVKKEMKIFINKNKNKKIIILDIPLLLENRINKKQDILVYVDSKKKDIEKQLRKRANLSRRLINRFEKIQFLPSYKKSKSIRIEF